ncbi:MAG: hypothetical protein AAFW46_01785 [Pseudomonadota bacterium]
MAAQLTDLDAALVAATRAAARRRDEASEEPKRDRAAPVAGGPQPARSKSGRQPARAESGRRPPNGWLIPTPLFESVLTEFRSALGDEVRIAATPAAADRLVRIDAALLQEALRDALALAADAIEDARDGAAEVDAAVALDPSGALDFDLTIRGALDVVGSIAETKRRAGAARLRQSAQSAGAEAALSLRETDETGATALLIRLRIPATRVRAASEL